MGYECMQTGDLVLMVAACLRGLFKSSSCESWTALQRYWQYSCLHHYSAATGELLGMQTGI